MEAIKVVHGDTASTPYDWGSVASRTTFNTGNAVRMACEDAKRQLFELASTKLEVPPEELETREGKIYVKGTPEVSIPISSLFSQTLVTGTGYIEEGAEIVGRATWSLPPVPTDPETGQTRRLSAFFIHGAQAAEVAVDTETGQVKVLRFVGAFDMGRPINPKLCEAQIEGGAGMGIGSTVYEEMLMDQGKVMNPNFLDYRFPTIKEIPIGENIAALLACAPHREGPYGAKGLGEGVLAPTAPAIASAVYDAIGVRMKDLPLSPERILKALRETEAQK